LAEGFGGGGAGREFSRRFQSVDHGGGERGERDADGGAFLQEETGFGQHELGDHAVALAIDDEVKIRRGAREFAARQVIGSVVVEERLLTVRGGSINIRGSKMKRTATA